MASRMKKIMAVDGYLAMSTENMYLTKSRVTLFEGMLTSK